MNKIKISAVSRRRLTVLADFLDTLPADVFNLSNWFSNEAGGIRTDAKGYIGAGITVSEMKECGAAACALGWACTIPSFKKAGLRLETGSEIPVFSEDSGYHAAMGFFHICLQISHFLFSPNYYKTWQATKAKSVAKRIREYLFDPDNMFSAYS